MATFYIDGSPEDASMFIRKLFLSDPQMENVRLIRLWIGLLNVEVALSINGIERAVEIPTSIVAGPEWRSLLETYIFTFIEEC